jgi:cystathionine beta-lyase family protein involved in aluminum resistance
MIIKVGRKSRTGRVWETYVYVPDTYSFRSAIIHIQRSKGITKRKGMWFERVFDEMNISKSIKHFNHNDHAYRVPK